MLAGQSMQTIALLAFALSFSSTVFVVKVLEGGANHALYGRVAIGILVMQDIIAVIFLTATGGHPPSPWALALVGLWPLTRVLRRIWTRLGHGEMQSLFGIVMALVPGYALFSSVGLKGDLGALIVRGAPGVAPGVLRTRAVAFSHQGAAARRFLRVDRADRSAGPAHHRRHC